MKRTIAVAAAALCGAGLLAGCSSNEDKFAKELRSAGYTAVGEPHTETEKKTKKVGGRTVKSSEKIMEVVVNVKGCDLEFAKTVGQSGYWLDELHVNGQEPDWPGYPENLNAKQAEQLLAGSGVKPAGIEACYKP